MSKNTISESESLKILSNSLSDVALTVATTIISNNPYFAVLLLTGKGIFTAWGDYGQARLNELLLSLQAEVESIKSEVVNKDEFKGLFLDILDKHMRETSEIKRSQLRRYLVSVAQGKAEGFSNHTKLLVILNQITADEFRLFMLLPSIIQDSRDEMESLGGTLNSLDMNAAQVQMRLHNWFQTEGQIERLLKFLGNYGLIVTQDTSTSTIGGSSTHVTFMGLTDSGWGFYKFLDDPSIDKTVKKVW